MTKYGPLEEVLKDINNREIKLDDAQIKQNNLLLNELMTEFIKEFTKDSFFKSIYQSFFFGGSYYDGLKVGEPDEFDIDLLFTLPKHATPTIHTDDYHPGYVQVELPTLDQLIPNHYEPSYTNMKKLLTTDNYLHISKIMRWFQSMVDKAKTALSQQQLRFTFSKTVVRNQGPAVTFTISDNYRMKMFDVDFVPCFKFFEDKWPKNCKRSENWMFGVNDQLTQEFFVVPKMKHNQSETHLRLSFQGQERRLLNDKGHIKPAIKLLKFYRNNYNDKKISSYYLKTVSLWALEDPDFRYNRESLSSIFLQLFKRYLAALGKKRLQYFWNEHLNLFEGCTSDYLSNLYNRVEKHLKEMECIENKEDKRVAKILRVQVQSRDIWTESAVSDSSDSEDYKKLMKIINPGAQLVVHSRCMNDDDDVDDDDDDDEVADSFSRLQIARSNRATRRSRRRTAEDTASFSGLQIARANQASSSSSGTAEAVGFGVILALGAAALAGVAIFGAIERNRRPDN